MSKIGEIVQPFQSQKIIKNIPEWSAGAADSNAPVILRVGYIGKTKIARGSFSISGSVYQERKPTEQKKQ